MLPSLCYCLRKQLLFKQKKKKTGIYIFWDEKKACNGSSSLDSRKKAQSKRIHAEKGKQQIEGSVSILIGLWKGDPKLDIFEGEERTNVAKKKNTPFFERDTHIGLKKTHVKCFQGTVSSRMLEASKT